MCLNPDGSPPADPKADELLATHIVLWPLIASCSIIVAHPDAPFKPEYIVPQMALQWVTKNAEFEGIVYFSTHVKHVMELNRSPLPTCNLVFPAKEIRPQGRCSRLRSLFKMTQPIGWELVRAINAGNKTLAYSGTHFDMEFMEGVAEPYWNTEFGIIQTKLASRVAAISYENANVNPSLGDVNG